MWPTGYADSCDATTTESRHKPPLGAKWSRKDRPSDRLFYADARRLAAISLVGIASLAATHAVFPLSECPLCSWPHNPEPKGLCFGIACIRLNSLLSQSQSLANFFSVAFPELVSISTHTVAQPD